MAWVVTAGIVAADVRLPTGYAVGVLYVGVILAGLWIPRPAFVFQYAVVATALGVLGLVTPWTGGHWTVDPFNCVMATSALWITAGGMTLYRRASAVRDAAEARLREQASLAELGKMAAAVAHEVRNALTGIGSSFELMYESAPPGTLDDIRAQVRQRLAAVNHTLTDLLVFAETRSPRLAPVPLQDLVDQAVTMARTTPTCAHIFMGVDVPDIAVNADRAHLARVLFNLILNGAQAMQGQGGIAIRAEVCGNRWQLEVVDRGSGISPAVRARLFEPFFSTRSHGAGLGLAFARRIVHSHGGTIDLRCPPDGGTTAVLNLPM